MDDFIHYGLYILTLVCFIVPLFGLGFAPGIVVNLLVGAFQGNIFAQLEDGKVIPKYLEENKSSVGAKLFGAPLRLLQKAVEGFSKKFK